MFDKYFAKIRWTKFVFIYCNSSKYNGHVAFFGGKLFGNRKIIPKISKGKTIEGSLIGLFSTILMSYFIRELVDFNINYAFICGLIISILAFVGDLVESLFKRKMGVKDSGKLIPGHGGLLDRFDGYLLVIPFIYFFII